MWDFRGVRIRIFAVLGCGQQIFQRIGTKFRTELKSRSADFETSTGNTNGILGMCKFVSVSIAPTIFFTDFQHILHAAQKCGRFDSFCLWDKPEVVFQF